MDDNFWFVLCEWIKFICEINSRSKWFVLNNEKSTELFNNALPKRQTHREVGTQSKGSVIADSLAAEVFDFGSLIFLNSIIKMNYS
jgi:hypothetical protein